MKVKNDHRSKFSNLSNSKEEAWKNQSFNGIRSRDLRVTGALLYQLSCEATLWERSQFIEFISPVRSEMMWSISEIFHFLLIASSFQLLKLEKIYCDDHSSLSYTTAVQKRKKIKYFIYNSRHFTPHGRYELNKLTSLPMSGFIAQLVEQRTGNAEVTASNPVEALIFSKTWTSI